MAGRFANLRGTTELLWKIATGQIDASALTAQRSYALPDKSGTLALLDDITGGGGMKPPTSLSTPFHSPGNAFGPGASSSTGALLQDAGSLSAGTWQQVATASGEGVLQVVAIRQNSRTSQQIGIRLTIDGSVVMTFDNPSASAAGACVIAIGSSDGAANLADGIIPFNTGFTVEVRSSIARTAGSSVQYIVKHYRTD